MNIYEPVEHGKEYPAKIHILPISSASYHWHYDYEFLLMLKGNLELEIDNQNFLLEPGDVCFINSCVVHNLKNDGGSNFCLVIQIGQEMFHRPGTDASERYAFYLNTKDPLHMPVGGFEMFRALVAEIGYTSLSVTEGKDYRIKGLLYLLIGLMFENTVYDIRMNEQMIMHQLDEDLFEMVLNYLQIHYREEDVLDTMRKALGVGEKTIYRFVKKYLSMTPRDLLLEIRLEAAKYLLRSTNSAIDYIADDCGFGSENSFFRLFKKTYGLTPSEYRKYRSGQKYNPRIDGKVRITNNELQDMIALYIPWRK